ncbi:MULTISPECIES: LysR family transcriptional regulator [Burkholderia cepacia complex]|uniref:LysR family transcriptional regulator n=1 Tax=Burkholderia cepacia TaxID=292 RepID=A0AAE8NKK0_BURCE|nr:LysR family transcriptional regulator [Burkholderia cepacia]KVF64851.1 LysR family transcriptional regulator [Burkholderia cepacia]MBY4798927.1 LysR family transcriptional regulator [Burkholderia cepacia]POM14065.1 HTH-type transcriptional regulator PgrR [Burkholderia cepacia]SQA57285.1 LysR family transcriptional regulator [Burkholderia cepacia]
MRPENFNDLYAFLVVARQRSFTKAANEMGTSSSALSQTISALEARLGVRLLSRTTRSVAPTTAGERLLQKLSMGFGSIGDELEALLELRERPVGSFRLTTVGHAAETILWPKLLPLLKAYPEIQVEVSVDYRMVDIVAERFDAGVRLGGLIDKDMVAVRISPDKRMAVVATPDYFRGRTAPRHPTELGSHTCINLRIPSTGTLLPWSFERDGVVLSVPVAGQCTFNGSGLVLQAALGGIGVGCVPEDIAEEHVRAGRLVRTLEDWCKPLDGYHLYYPSRRQPNRAFQLLVDALKYRA